MIFAVLIGTVWLVVKEPRIKEGIKAASSTGARPFLLRARPAWLGILQTHRQSPNTKQLLHRCLRMNRRPHL
ncbi:MAG TPA: hypothetical protein VHD88_03715 [Pyrinomonadaceae bacterium]|nr:hypothetical protein [Pyrinomonadaceae bacterium]